MGFYDAYHGVNEMVKELCIELVRMSDEHMAEVREANGGVDSMTDEELLEHGLVRLPKDANGVPVHVGDTVYTADGSEAYVARIDFVPDVPGVELRFPCGTISEYVPRYIYHTRPDSRDGSGYADTFAFAHHHAPTVEDVLREFAERYLDYEGMPSAGRRGVGEALMDEYAAKLQLRENK